jgi:hypothetical protein
MIGSTKNSTQAIGLLMILFHSALVHASIHPQKHPLARPVGPDARRYLRVCPKDRP